MKEDPIIQEIRDIRREIMAECDNDSEKLYKYLRRVQKEWSKTHKMVSGSPKPLVRAKTGT